MLVIAGPGSGKTRALAARILHFTSSSINLSDTRVYEPEIRLLGTHRTHWSETRLNQSIHLISSDGIYAKNNNGVLIFWPWDQEFDASHRGAGVGQDARARCPHPPLDVCDARRAFIAAAPHPYQQGCPLLDHVHKPEKKVSRK